MKPQSGVASSTIGGIALPQQNTSFQWISANLSTNLFALTMEHAEKIWIEILIPVRALFSLVGNICKRHSMGRTKNRMHDSKFLRAIQFGGNSKTYTLLGRFKFRSQTGKFSHCSLGKIEMNYVQGSKFLRAWDWPIVTRPGICLTKQIGKLTFETSTALQISWIYGNENGRLFQIDSFWNICKCKIFHILHGRAKPE